MGVRRAVEMAMLASDSIERSGDSIYTLGPLIHNARVLETLYNRGVICLDEKALGHVPKGSTVIIRAHGITPSVEKALADQGQKILDATCPNVKASQHKARCFADKGYSIFLAGDENHAEIAGIRGYAKDEACFVVANPDMAAAAAAELSCKEPSAKTVLIGQTTISPKEYIVIGEAILSYFPNLEIIDSICSATAERQDALRKLSEQVDALIIAGSRESANTRRLLALAQDLGKPAWLVESASDLPPEIRDYATIGLGAGASTPISLIDEIEKAVEMRN